MTNLERIYYMFQDSDCKHWFRDNADMLELAKYLNKNGYIAFPKRNNLDLDSLDFSKCSIDEKFWALLLLIFATCKDVDFVEKIKEKFEVDNNEAKEILTNMEVDGE